MKIATKQSQAVLSPFMRCGVRCLDDVYSRVSGRALKGGCILVIQTHGRNGQYNPHLHIIATSGGRDQQTKQWVHLDYVPYRLLRKKWQWSPLTMLRQTVKTQEMKQLVEVCYTRYRKGFVINVQKGDVPARYQSLARYLAKYVVSPPISLRRIDCYDGYRVTYHYRSHTSERMERERVDVYTFIGRMVHFVLPHASVRQLLAESVRTYGTGSAKLWRPCTPAMAAGLTDHIWTLKEVLLYRVPPWPQAQLGLGVGKDGDREIGQDQCACDPFNRTARGPANRCTSS